MGLETAALIGLALSAAGTGAQMYSASETARKQNEAAKAEFGRQKQYQKEGTQAFQQSLAQSTPAVQKAQEQAGQERIAQEIAKVGQAPMTVSAPSVSPSSIVGQETEAGKRLIAAPTAAYQGMSEWQLRQWIKDLRAQQQLGIIANLARGSARTLPFVLNQAGQSEAGLNTLGQGLGAAGSVVGAYGATRGGGSDFGVNNLPASQRNLYQAMWNRARLSDLYGINQGLE